MNFYCSHIFEQNLHLFSPDCKTIFDHDRESEHGSIKFIERLVSSSQKSGPWTIVK